MQGAEPWERRRGAGDPVCRKRQLHACFLSQLACTELYCISPSLLRGGGSETSLLGEVFGKVVRTPWGHQRLILEACTGIPAPHLLPTNTHARR